jgi:hypothetical protein
VFYQLITGNRPGTTCWLERFGHREGGETGHGFNCRRRLRSGHAGVRFPAAKSVGAGDNEAMAMTEQEWLDGTDPTKMMRHLATKADKRRSMLFACACQRRLSHQSDCQRQLLETMEQDADGQATPSDVLRTLQDIGDDVDLVYVTSSVGKSDWAISESLDSAAFVADAVLGDSVMREGGVTEALKPDLARKAVYDAEKGVQCTLLRDIFGNPFRPVTLNPVWQTSNVTALAQSIYDDRAFDRLPILADALEDAGCDNADILNHGRQPGEHVRRCWVVDLVLGKR